MAHQSLNENHYGTSDTPNTPNTPNTLSISPDHEEEDDDVGSIISDIGDDSRSPEDLIDSAVQTKGGPDDDDDDKMDDEKDQKQMEEEKNKEIFKQKVQNYVNLTVQNYELILNEQTSDFKLFYYKVLRNKPSNNPSFNEAIERTTKNKQIWKDDDNLDGKTGRGGNYGKSDLPTFLMDVMTILLHLNDPVQRDDAAIKLIVSYLYWSIFCTEPRVYVEIALIFRGTNYNPLTGDGSRMNGELTTKIAQKMESTRHSMYVRWIKYVTNRWSKLYAKLNGDSLLKVEEAFSM